MSLLKQSLICSASLAVFAGTTFSRDLYWSEEKKIFASDIDGGNVTEIFDGEVSTPVMESYIVDIDATEDYIYWTGHDGGDVWRAARDGSNPERIVSGTNASAHFLEVDEAAGTIRFTDFRGRVLQTDLDGQNLVSLFSNTMYDGLVGFVSNPNPSGNNDEVWALRSNSPFLFSLILDPEYGGFADGYESLEGGNGNYGIVYVEANNTIYYTNHTEGSLRSYNLNTKEQQLLLTPGMQRPLDLELSPSGTHLLIAERGRGVSGYELDGGGYELLVDAPGSRFAVAVAADPGSLEVPEAPEPVGPGTVLLAADFEGDEVGSLPTRNAPWTTVRAPAEGSALVAQDHDNFFASGEENKFLRVESARHFSLIGHFEETDVVTLAFDYIGRVNEGDYSRALNLNLRAGNANTDRVHVIQLNPESGRVDGVNLGENDRLYRFDLVVNNSTDTIEYEKPDGTGLMTLNSGRSVLWRYDYQLLDWALLRDDYTNVRHASVNVGDKMLNFEVQVDSGSSLQVEVRSFDMDNILLFNGAVPGAQLREVSAGGGYSDWASDHFPDETDVLVIGPDADPDGDGIPNLLEYALNLDPNSASREGLPVTEVQTLAVDGEEGDYLVLVKTVPDGMGDLGYVVEASSDAGFGEVDEGVMIDARSNGDGSTTYVFRDVTPIREESRRFMRLRVTVLD